MDRSDPRPGGSVSNLELGQGAQTPLGVEGPKILAVPHAVDAQRRAAERDASLEFGDLVAIDAIAHVGLKDEHGSVVERLFGGVASGGGTIGQEEDAVEFRPGRVEVHADPVASSAPQATGSKYVVPPAWNMSSPSETAGPFRPAPKATYATTARATSAATPPRMTRTSRPRRPRIGSPCAAEAAADREAECTVGRAPDRESAADESDEPWLVERGTKCIPDPVGARSGTPVS